jgi:hypothetical protein
MFFSFPAPSLRAEAQGEAAKDLKVYLYCGDYQDCDILRQREGRHLISDTVVCLYLGRRLDIRLSLAGKFVEVVRVA